MTHQKKVFRRVTARFHEKRCRKKAQRREDGITQTDNKHFLS